MLIDRCYGLSCSKDDLNPLFEEYTLRHTEEAAMQTSDLVWTCTGKRILSEAGLARLNVCSLFTEVLWRDAAIQSTFEAMEPPIEKIMTFFGIIDTGSQSVDFSALESRVDNHETACYEAGGVLKILNTTSFACKEVSTRTDTLQDSASYRARWDTHLCFPRMQRFSARNSGR